MCAFCVLCFLCLFASSVCLSRFLLLSVCNILSPVISALSPSHLCLIIVCSCLLSYSLLHLCGARLFFFVFLVSVVVSFVFLWCSLPLFLVMFMLSPFFCVCPFRVYESSLAFLRLCICVCVGPLLFLFSVLPRLVCSSFLISVYDILLRYDCLLSCPVSSFVWFLACSLCCYVHLFS